MARRRSRSRGVPATSEVWTAPSYPGYSPVESTKNAVRWWAIVRRHRVGVLAILLLCLAGSVLVTLLSAPIYRSKALLEVMAVNQDFMNNKNVDPNVSTSAPDAYIETQTKLLMSDTVAERVIKVLLPSAS